MSATPIIVQGRNCDGCAMCCKIPEIKALSKPKGAWCTHCSTRQKCDSYLERPEACRNFHCGYLLQADIGEEWRPLTSRMMITYTEDGQHLFVQVDPTRPDAWRRAPYLQQLKSWARINNPRGQQIIVSVGNRYIVIYPDREEDLGTVGEDETVTFTVDQTPSGLRTHAQKVKI